MRVILFLIVFVFLIGLGFTSMSVYAQSQTLVSVITGSAAPGCEELKICYSPYSIHVNAGETVTWSNDDTAAPGCEELKICYSPYSIHVNAGETVTWSNDDTAAHTVTSGHPGSSDGVFDSSLFMAGSTFSHTFNQPGTFHYFCIIHPWMEGEVIVENSSNSQTFAKTISNEIGSAQLDQSIYHVKQNENFLVKIFGTISNPLKESKVEITITNPEYDSDGSSVITTDNGYYELFFPLDYDSPEGTYKALNSIIVRLLLAMINFDWEYWDVARQESIKFDSVCIKQNPS